MSKLDDVLNNSLREIKDELNKKAKGIILKAREDYQKTLPNLNEKIDRIEEINDIVEGLVAERDQLNLDIKNADPSITGAEHKKAKEKYWAAVQWHSYSARKSDVEVAKVIYKTKEIMNITAFDTIEAQIRNQFNLAITNKQKQQVIFNLQTTIDWKSLGINLPNMFEAAKVEIKNGAIIIDNALPNKVS